MKSNLLIINFLLVTLASAISDQTIKGPHQFHTNSLSQVCSESQTDLMDKAKQKTKQMSGPLRQVRELILMQQESPTTNSDEDKDGAIKDIKLNISKRDLEGVVKKWVPSDMEDDEFMIYCIVAAAIVLILLVLCCIFGHHHALLFCCLITVFVCLVFWYLYFYRNKND